MESRRGFMMAFAIACGIITYTEIKDCREMPWPPRYIGAGLVFSILDVFSIVSPALADAMAFGFVLALIVRPKKFGTPNCTHATGTVAPAAWTTLHNQSMSGVTQQPSTQAASQPAQTPGMTPAPPPPTGRTTASTTITPPSTVSPANSITNKIKNILSRYKAPTTRRTTGSGSSGFS